MTWFGSLGWSNSDDAPSTSNNNNATDDDYFINMVHFRKRNCKRKEDESTTLNIGIDIDAKLKQAVEREQNTRRLTKDRERLKQITLRKKKEETRVFDIALLINCDGEYYKILCGPVVYEVFYGYIRFTNSQQYMHHDIDILHESAQLIEELDAKHVHEYFCNYSSDPNDRCNGVPFDFGDVCKLELYRFAHENDGQQRWKSHKYSQTKTRCDVLIVFNKENVAQYVLMNVHCDLIDEEIHFEELHEYQAGDDVALENLATKLQHFAVKQSYSFYKRDICQYSFHYNFGNAMKSTFSGAICYNFVSKKAADEFYHQSYDFALTTNAQDEFLYILRDVTYDLILGQIQYDSSRVYINGDYAQLKACGEEMKCMKKIKSFDSIHDAASHQINSHATKQCILFNICDSNSWTQYVETSLKMCHFDVATITNTEDYLVYILLDVTVNWIDKIIHFTICDTFKPRHDEIIQRHGESICQEKLSTFTFRQVNGFKNEALNNIFFFQLKSAHHEKKDITLSAASSSSSSPVPKVSKISKVSSLDLTQRDSIMPDRLSVLNRMQNVTKIRHKLFNEKEKKIIEKKEAAQVAIDIDDNLICVWNSYQKLYGFQPQTAQQLKSFSRMQNEIPTLSYFQARTVFNHFGKRSATEHK